MREVGNETVPLIAITELLLTASGKLEEMFVAKLGRQDLDLPCYGMFRLVIAAPFGVSSAWHTYLQAPETRILEEAMRIL